MLHDINITNNRSKYLTRSILCTSFFNVVRDEHVMTSCLFFRRPTYSTHCFFIGLRLVYKCEPPPHGENWDHERFTPPDESNTLLVHATWVERVNFTLLAAPQILSEFLS